LFIIVDKPVLLKPGDVVKFGLEWPKPFEGKFFKIVKNMLLKWDYYTLIASGGKVELEVAMDHRLTPTHEKTLYEIYMGFHPKLAGLILLYIMWPTTDWLHKFEYLTEHPNPEDPVTRYINFFDARDMVLEFVGPKLRMYTVRAYNPFKLVFYNDSPEEEKIVARFYVNRCKLEEIKEVPEYRFIPGITDLVTW